MQRLDGILNSIENEFSQRLIVNREVRHSFPPKSIGEPCQCSNLSLNQNNMSTPQDIIDVAPKAIANNSNLVTLLEKEIDVNLAAKMDRISQLLRTYRDQVAAVAGDAQTERGGGTRGEEAEEESYLRAEIQKLEGEIANQRMAISKKEEDLLLKGRSIRETPAENSLEAVSKVHDAYAALE